MNSIQQRIHDLLRERLVLQEAIDWVNIEELAAEIVSELGLYRNLAWVKQCRDGEWRQLHGRADTVNPEAVPGQRYCTPWEPQP